MHAFRFASWNRRYPPLASALEERLIVLRFLVSPGFLKQLDGSESFDIESYLGTLCETRRKASSLSAFSLPSRNNFSALPVLIGTSSKDRGALSSLRRINALPSVSSSRLPASQRLLDFFETVDGVKTDSGTVESAESSTRGLFPADFS